MKPIWCDGGMEKLDGSCNNKVKEVFIAVCITAWHITHRDAVVRFLAFHQLGVYYYAFLAATAVVRSG